MSDKKPTNKMKPRSGLVTDGMERAPARGMLRAVGFKDDDFAKAQIGIASSWNEIKENDFKKLEKYIKELKSYNFKDFSYSIITRQVG